MIILHYVEASWVTPAEQPPGDRVQKNSSTEAAVRREEMMHTGRLRLKILKAESEQT